MARSLKENTANAPAVGIFFTFEALISLMHVFLKLLTTIFSAILKIQINQSFSLFGGTLHGYPTQMLHEIRIFEHMKSFLKY